jgi:predicted metal-dependent hydrolase
MFLFRSFKKQFRKVKLTEPLQEKGSYTNKKGITYNWKIVKGDKPIPPAE